MSDGRLVSLYCVMTEVALCLISISMQRPLEVILLTGAVTKDCCCETELLCGQRAHWCRLEQIWSETMVNCVTYLAPPCAH